MWKMNYELAIKLQDAGFPQTKSFLVKFSLKNEPIELPFIEGAQATTLGGIEEWRVITPTLSELIEACGDRFGGLIRNEANNEFNLTKDKWTAYATRDFWITMAMKDFPGRDCISPTEAVANLWLALNKK